MPYNILATGGCGYVGSELIIKLVEMGHKVYCLDDLKYGINYSIVRMLNYDNFELLKYDLCENFSSIIWKKIENIIQKCDFVIHLAGLVGYPACEKNVEFSKRINYEVTKKISDICAKYSIKLLYSSTGSNYGKIDGICTEESPLNPLSTYAIHKCQAEKYVVEHCDSIAFRFATAFGVSSRMRHDLFINDMVCRAIKDSSAILYEPENSRTFIYVTDMALLFIFAIENMKNKQGVYNAGDERMNLTKKEILYKIKQYLPNFYFTFAEYCYDKDGRDYMVSYKKLESEGFKCNIFIDEGIKRLINYYNIIKSSYKEIISCDNII